MPVVFVFFCWYINILASSLVYQCTINKICISFGLSGIIRRRYCINQGTSFSISVKYNPLKQECFDILTVSKQ